jgi:hypothetical protein
MMRVWSVGTETMTRRPSPEILADFKSWLIDVEKADGSIIFPLAKPRQGAS